MNIIEATRSYEAWLGRQTHVVRADLQAKHQRIAESPFVFLRGTHYRWVQLWPAICSRLADAPAVLAVGDLHVENFGTWRDAEGRLVWGVNDLDEAARLPYTSDLVRLATSAVLAVRDRQMALSVRRICTSILDGYHAALERGGRPLVLAERHAWLRQIALQELKDPVRFWERVNANRRAVSVPASLMRQLALPKGCTDVRVLRRQAGVGSLGRPRFVALAMHQGGLIAREAKAMIPSAVAWATDAEHPDTHVTELIRRAVRALDPFFTADGGWTVRRLSPDCLKIEVGTLAGQRDDAKLLRAMGWETANIHLGSHDAKIAGDLKGRSRRWLEHAAMDMVDVLAEEHREWKRAGKAGGAGKAGRGR
jgi:uncharacterized protein (DUF2252 family)